ncbi:MAG: hypothetical protein Q7L55_08430 [Actinomycetota bacterium]|nr:hypothetical protein [Actinomycetota bacterium]
MSRTATVRSTHFFAGRVTNTPPIHNLSGSLFARVLAGLSAMLGVIGIALLLLGLRNESTQNWPNSDECSILGTVFLGMFAVVVGITLILNIRDMRNPRYDPDWRNTSTDFDHKSCWCSKTEQESRSGANSESVIHAA